ncbi:sigma-70 family RNA polymerase sigma factor [Candidatus Parcubacteria bacterium]|nr:sigma-70 family RNA polymerase sigma factor [Candidatus Parcubacteria bacterium]
MENTILNSYLREITKFPKLSKEEELELGCQFCDENNPYAREKLIKHNLRLAVKEAFKFKGEKVELLELIQEGTEGLIEAVDRYDYKFGYRLAVYAEWWIAQYIKKAIMEKNRNFPAHIPINVQMEHSNINKTIKFLESKLGREPNFQEISKETGFSVKKIKFIFEKMGIYNVSLDSPIKFKNNERGSRNPKEMSEIIGENFSLTAEQILKLKEELRMLLEKILKRAKRKFWKKSFKIFCEFCGFNKEFIAKSAEEIARDFLCTRRNIYEVTNKILLTSYLVAKEEGYIIEKGENFTIKKSEVRKYLERLSEICAWIQKKTGSKIINFDKF